MRQIHDDLFSAKTAFKNRYSPSHVNAAHTRHDFYLSMRGHLNAGWLDLPADLAIANVQDMARMANGRRDKRMLAACRQWLKTADAGQGTIAS
jgi:hypothetical protein